VNQGIGRANVAIAAMFSNWSKFVFCHEDREGTTKIAKKYFLKTVPVSSTGV
jgi:hypothetical protein